MLEVSGSTDKQITGLAIDSRKVAEGMLFAALRGTQTDGHIYIPQAVSAGAVAVLCEEFPDTTDPSVVYLKVQDSSATLGTVAANYHEHPSAKLKLVGITGTNGKTTCVTLLYKLFGELGYKCGLLSTVRNEIAGEVLPATHTTPDVLTLNEVLSGMVRKKCDYAFMEVSSHAIAQQRIAGLQFSGGVFTNITHDHLDYHKTFSAYLEAKKAFFDALPAEAFALVNTDDKRGSIMLQNTNAHHKTFGLKGMADFHAKVLENHFSGMLLHIDGEEVLFRLVGEFNAYNLLAVYAAAMLLEQDKRKVLTVLSRLTGAEGRFECLIAPNNVIGIVDYAHTPDALRNVLETIHQLRLKNERVITVVGCGGDRDASKRPVMAQVACNWSDQVILTSDNPRSEDPEAIIRDMETGIPEEGRQRVLSISNRKEAIKTAFLLAKPGEIILIAGKGHETYQEIKGVKHPFDDKQVLMSQFENL